MGMGIELFSIREWEWELIHIFWQRMGMGIELQFNSFLRNLSFQWKKKANYDDDEFTTGKSSRCRS